MRDTNQTLDAELVETSVTDNARYSTFNMLDRAIDGDAKAACKALLKIREEGTEAIAIIGAVAYQLRNLLALAGYAKTRQLAQGFKAQRILPRRQKAVGAAVERLTMNELEQCVQLLGRADALYKSGQAQVCWMALEAVILSLAGKALNSNPVLASFRVY